MKKITVSEGYIEIHVQPGFIYDIPVDQLVSDYVSGRMDWIAHLRDKNWFDSATEASLVNAIKKECPRYLELRKQSGAA